MINLADDKQLWNHNSLHAIPEDTMTSYKKYIALRSKDSKSVIVFPYSASTLEFVFNAAVVNRKDVYDYSTGDHRIEYKQIENDNLIIEIIDESEIAFLTKTQVQ